MLNHGVTFCCYLNVGNVILADKSNGQLKTQNSIVGYYNFTAIADNKNLLFCCQQQQCSR